MPAPLAWIELIAGAMLMLIAIAAMGIRRRWNALYPLGFATFAIGGALSLRHGGDSAIPALCIAVGSFTLGRFSEWAANASKSARVRRQN